MIGILGQAPISSVTTAGRSSFVSLLNNNVHSGRLAKSYKDDPSRHPRPYTTTRGVLISKEAVESKPIDFTKGYQFQFNPQTISDIKTTLYETRGYTGLSYNDYIWSGGGERIISFQLFLDNTPQSKTQAFRPDAYGSKLANTIKIEGKGFTYDEYGRITGTGDKGYFGKHLVDEVVSSAKSLASSAWPTKGPASFEYEGGAFSNSRIDARGILPEVEKIQSFLYPAPLKGENTPLFAEGGVVNHSQFRPPATVILSVGPLYLEGVVKSAPVQYTLFDQDLTPLRATIDIEFAVYEFDNISREF